MPRITFKNSTPIIADSFRIEKISLDTTWEARTYAFNEPVDLDWLLPGRGALYRITPYSSATNDFGVSFNGGVRAERPALDTLDRDAFFVVERDSAIYLRAVAADGKQSREMRLSDSTDLTASPAIMNINPVIASVRNTNSSGEKPCLVLWERRDSSTMKTTIEAAYLQQLPRSDSLPQFYRFRLTAPRSFITGGLNLSQWMSVALTGVNGGWVAAWAHASRGIEVKAIHANPLGLTGGVVLGPNDTSLTLIARLRQQDLATSGLNQLPDSIAYFPTLAYRPHRDNVRINDWRSSTTAVLPEDDPNEKIITAEQDTSALMQLAHLSYQQGTPNIANTQFIMYNRVGVEFPF
jgi:hypothetical protein